jgi:rubrerythrin
MSVAARVDSDTQLARLLQIGAVLEEVVEARAARHYERVPEAERDPEVEALLKEAKAESARHREALEDLVAALDAESTPIDRVESLVAEQYAAPGDTDGILYDQLHGEETAYKFYDDLITALEESEARFNVDRERLLATLRELRAEEEAGVEEVTELMGRTNGGSR